MNGIYNGGKPTANLKIKTLQEVPLYGATKNFITLQILYPIGIFWRCFRNIEGIDPKGIKFSMLSLVLPGVITLKCTTQAYLASGQLMPLPSQSHAEQNLKKPLKSSNLHPNLSLGTLDRLLVFYCTRVTAG
jgi:hypothetical protein